ncbi:hypothetical protein NliqN6_2351 [Naganishia liquefaciens]|uniref:Protein phosphatase n=1 Tax=Naganishia liquefaciens TaxID=104408 RepID=A0A8H3TS19_9TREE|nr:hypothetical protein NliqN6_2351 [Naganishia liquefaciens]
MSKPPTTPYHLLRRGTASPSNVSSAFSTLALGTQRGAAVVASAGIGMGLGTAAAGVVSSPWSVGAGNPLTAGLAVLPGFVRSRSPSPTPTVPRNRGAIPLRRLTTSAARPSAIVTPIPSAIALPPYRLAIPEEARSSGYEQHRTGLQLTPSEDPIPRPRGLDRARPRPRHRVWDLRASRNVGWNLKASEKVDAEIGIVAGYNGISTHPPITLRQTQASNPIFTSSVLQAPVPVSPPLNSHSGKPTTASPSSSPPRHVPHFVLNASASGIPKQRHQTPSPRDPSAADPLSNTTATQVGEDAYYLRPESLGISDGVGGWSNARRKRQQRRVIRFDGDEGGKLESWVEGEGDADPGRFSRLLMHFCEREVEDWRRRVAKQEGKEGKDGKGKEVLDPVVVMQQGYEKCIECVQNEGIFGSATCLVAVLAENQLKIANLGDCAIIVVRRGEIVFRTEEMQHSFNFPLQLGTNSRDEPMKDAEYYEVQVEEGDIIVMCSDGLSDNLFDEDILEIIAAHTPPDSPAQPQALSEALCKSAEEASEETGSASPFMCRAIEEGLDFMGGKKDDISVLVAVVADRDGLEGST